MAPKKSKTAMTKAAPQIETKKAQRTKEIEATKKQRIEKIQRKMNDLKKAHEQELRKIQAPKIARLRDLIQARREIDNKITTCWSHIDQAYESTTQQYQFALRGRLEDLG
ncbi:hypothetical protein PRZ48_008307 [Zasmidium cellare]|uniref:Uncharacterized protein n=1 Tax=Zasmidium cellare TaxID=395010 RepID=A0ABR0EFV3_ZASCE|nr:hypothetical protein PRZ48_008307 [Zasmidium cellare]